MGRSRAPGSLGSGTSDPDRAGKRGAGVGSSGASDGGVRPDPARGGLTMGFTAQSDWEEQEGDVEASDWLHTIAGGGLAYGMAPSGGEEVAGAGLRGEGGRWRRLMIGLRGKQGGSGWEGQNWYGRHLNIVRGLGLGG